MGFAHTHKGFTLDPFKNAHACVLSFKIFFVSQSRCFEVFGQVFFKKLAECEAESHGFNGFNRILGGIIL